MEIFNYRQKMLMLRNAMLSKGNDNFATTVISTENAEKIGRSAKKESNLFFFLSY